LPPGQNLVHGLFDREFGVVQHQSVLRRLQGGNAAGHVPRVARLQVCTKVGYFSVQTARKQLLMAPLSPLGRTGGQINLEQRAWEDHRAHVAAVGHQAGEGAKSQLHVNDGSAHLGQGRNAVLPLNSKALQNCAGFYL